MNPRILTNNRKTLALVLCAVVATVGGSLAYAQTAEYSSDPTHTPSPIQGSINLPQLILSSVKTSFVTAANTAAGQVTNGQVLGGELRVMHGYVVYTFKVTNGTSVFSVIVDAGNGQVLRTSHGHPLTLASLFGGMGGGIRMHAHMTPFTRGWSGIPGGMPQNTTTPSGFQG